MKNIVVILAVIIGSVTILSVVGIVVFVTSAPQFGEVPDEMSREKFKAFKYFNGEKFINAVETKMDIHVTEFPKMMYEFYFVKGQKEPPTALPQQNFTRKDLTLHKDNNLYLRWFGHSAIYLEMDGKRILLDPMLGPAPSPHVLLGPNRFNRELPMKAEDLPEIDVVIFSHDHYDHLDYSTILKIKDKVRHFYVPLGVGSHLKKWGVSEEKITEMKWWEKAEFDGLTFISTPARHFSGRGIMDRNTTLWSSWVIQSTYHNIYFSGDGGYWKGFKEIGDKFGPFDFCMMECGAYNYRWQSIHMMPEETAQATVDLRCELMMPIHWGAFNLSLHDWDDSPKRVSMKAEELGIKLVTPVIGEEVIIPGRIPNEKWWESVSN